MSVSACRFTGISTGTGTREEHTIQRRLAGRFRSRTAASSEFNEACSQVLDAPLAEAYALIMSALGPLLSREHQPPDLDISGGPNDGRLVLAPGGIIRLEGTRIEARDPATGRPVAMSSASEANLLQRAQQVGIPPERMQKSAINPTKQRHVGRKQPILSAHVEVAVLKAALLTFDHLLHGSTAPFTRSNDIRPVRNAILDVVRGGDPLQLVASTSWGIDYRSRQAFLDLAGRHRPTPVTRFEHLLLVSATPGGAVDVFFLVAGVDLYRFRVCERWTGNRLQLLCGCGMLAQETPFGPISLSDDISFGDPTNLRSVFPQGSTAEQVAAATREIGEQRQRAYRDAVVLVEQRSDEVVRKQFADLELLGAATLQDAIAQRLGFLYDGELSAEERSVFSRVLEEGLAAIPAECLRARPTMAPEIQWLAQYRALFTRLADEVGLPDLIFGVETLPTRASDPPPT